MSAEWIVHCIERGEVIDSKGYEMKVATGPPTPAPSVSRHRSSTSPLLAARKRQHEESSRPSKRMALSGERKEPAGRVGIM